VRRRGNGPRRSMEIVCGIETGSLVAPRAGDCGLWEIGQHHGTRVLTQLSCRTATTRTRLSHQHFPSSDNIVTHTENGGIPLRSETTASLCMKTTTSWEFSHQTSTHTSSPVGEEFSSALSSLQWESFALSYINSTQIRYVFLSRSRRSRVLILSRSLRYHGHSRAVSTVSSAAQGRL
jgi:hypothetical protein